MRLTSTRALTLASLAFTASVVPSLSACSSGVVPVGGTAPGPSEQRTPAQTEFVSAPPAGQLGGAARGDGEPTAAPAEDSASGAKDTAAPERKVEETDLYRLDGTTLYYLNAYRGLMVFDVSNIDSPKFIGRSPIYGSPSEMIVRNGVATVVVGDWYGKDENGDPFYGSVVRTFDARNPASIKVLGDARVRGWVRDTRVVGDVMYTVSQDYGGNYYGYWYDDTVSQSAKPAILVTSVRFGEVAPQTIGTQEYSGYSAAFNVTAKSIVLAHDIPKDPNQPWSSPSGKTRVDLIDIQDPNGAISVKGGFDVDGSFQGWGTDSGRWNVDFASERYARVLTRTINQQGYYSDTDPYILSSVDFQTPASPALASSLEIPNPGWSVAARFSGNRLYLSPGNGYGSDSNQNTPVNVYDLTTATAPVLAGTVTIPGMVWNFTPTGTNGDKLFALGQKYNQNGGGYGSSQVAVNYIDATNPASPQLLGTSTFGEGWAWTPAAGTFKAFTLDKDKQLVVLPFSGWSETNHGYNNGLQLISFTDTSIATAGAAKTKGWVERGIFVGNRLVSLSDLALSVVDYSNPNAPKTTAELTLARNVVSTKPLGQTAVQLSTDWWGYDNSKSELRLTSLDNVDEQRGDATLQSVNIEGTNAQMFENGKLGYVVSTLVDKANNGTSTTQVQVVDMTSGKAVLRGKVALPSRPGYYGGYWGWSGCGWTDWWDSSDTVQVQGNALAFRRTHWQYDPATHSYKGDGTLNIVDLTNPDAPLLTSTAVTKQSDYWWGNMRAVGDTLYTTHYEWVQYPIWDSNTGKLTAEGKVKYFLDRIDLSDRANPHVESSVNVPGILVGASETDPQLLYFIDYRWVGDQQHDDFSVARIEGDKASLVGTTELDGYTGRVFVRGNKAYLSAQEYAKNGPAKVKLHEIDLTDPAHPVDRASAGKKGWGWMVGLEGDRALMQSGWSGAGIDIYRLNDGAAPTFDKFVRTRGWWLNSLARQNDTLLVSSGYWGVETISLK